MMKTNEALPDILLRFGMLGKAMAICEKGAQLRAAKGNMTAKWIWYPGEYELYHSLLLHNRREEYGADYPLFCPPASIYPWINFYKKADLAQDGYIKVTVKGKARIWIDGAQYATGVRIPLKKGSSTIMIRVMTADTFPAAYVESDCVPSDESWYASPTCCGESLEEMLTCKEYRCFPAACEPAYTSPEDDLTAFPFSYTPVSPVSHDEEGELVTYDFGKELFGPLYFSADSGERVTVIYGESREEATAPLGQPGEKQGALVYERVTGASHYSLRPRAFRYVSFRGKVTDVRAELVLLDLPYIGRFRCEDEKVGKVYDICAYTAHLCTREFLLDGIKRDHWCWSGDAYLSFIINAYLFGDEAVSKRSLLALYGKPPYENHINTINDYSALLLIGTWEYAFRTGDLPFIRFLWDKCKALYDFIIGRLREDGYVVKRKMDWIFVDWAEFDRVGALCAEQMLLWAATVAMGKLASLLGEDATCYTSRADTLKAAIDRDFWSEEKGGYIDSFESGKANVTRHANIFAILYDFCTPERANVIYQKVLANDSITKITTPYFEAYELMALCKLGHVEVAQQMITSYWGEMLKLGATTIWETFDPTLSGAEHYSMYESPFGKSLCHAWGAGPVAFLGKYCAGVAPTALGSEQFTVAPTPGLYSFFEADVPLRGGVVKVVYRDGQVRVLTSLSGGTLCFRGKTVPILPDTWTVL